jgi:hypothetical protein
MARALSVSEGKGAVRSWERRGRSGWGPSVWRGNWAAWVSGAEKSRQERQIAEGVGARAEDGGEALGLDVRWVERSGRENLGMGGGRASDSW